MKFTSGKTSLWLYYDKTPGTVRMLPLTRNRKFGMNSESLESTAEAMTSLRKSTFRLTRLPLKAKCFVVLLIVISVYLFGTIYLTWKDNRLTKEDFLEVKTCPACYGHKFCFSLFDDQFDLTGMSKYQMLDVINVKNVHYAYHKRKGHEVVVKKLAHNDEIKKVDDEICKDSGLDPGCNVAKRFVVSTAAQDITRNGLRPEHLKDTTFMFMCVTHKLIDLVLEKYVEKTHWSGEIFMDDKLQVLYTARVNPEPLILQTFPASEGWPFPEYYGACGRYIVEEHCGKSLENYVDAPFVKRADLAYQMLKMAQKLTSDPEWSLYWTDLVYNNFAVDSGGRLMYIDTENIIVVDKEATKTVNKEHWDDIAESEYLDCGEGSHSQDCLTFDVKELCTHYEADHNYYAVCRNMLSTYADGRSHNGQAHLLHSIPEYDKNHWDLENLLNECVRPHYAQGRIKAVHKLIQALDHIRDGKVVKNPI